MTPFFLFFRFFKYQVIVRFMTHFWLKINRTIYWLYPWAYQKIATKDFVIENKQCLCQFFEINSFVLKVSNFPTENEKFRLFIIFMAVFKKSADIDFEFGYRQPHLYFLWCVHNSLMKTGKLFQNQRTQ